MWNRRLLGVGLVALVIVLLYRSTAESSSFYQTTNVDVQSSGFEGEDGELIVVDTADPFDIAKDLAGGREPGAAGNEKITVVLMTHPKSKRAKGMHQVLQYYSDCPSVDKIILVLNGGMKPLKTYQGIAKVEFAEFAKNSMNNRFAIADRVETEAVLICDDDVLISSPLLDCFISKWEAQRHRLFGFDLRRAIGDRYSVGHDPEHHAIIVIGKTMVFHKRYLEAYMKDQEMVDWVSEPQFCEDIAMNALISSFHDEGPVLVSTAHYKGDPFFRRKKLPEVGGLSGKKGTWDGQRNFCVKWLNQHFGGGDFSFAQNADVVACSDAQGAGFSLKRRVRKFLEKPSEAANKAQAAQKPQTDTEANDQTDPYTVADTTDTTSDEND